MEEIKTNVAQETAADVNEKATEPKGEAAYVSDGVTEPQGEAAYVSDGALEAQDETATDESEKATEPQGEAAEASDGVFELRQTPKPENLKEMYFHYFFWRVPAIILISIFALYGLLGIGLLAYEIYRGQFEINSVIIIVLAFGMIAYRIFCYRTYSRLAFKRKEELGVVAEVVMKVGRESMYPEGHPESALRFTDIKRAYVTKNLVYLVTRAKNIVVFEKESFTVGDCKSFLSRLSRLGVKVPKKV